MVTGHINYVARIGPGYISSMTGGGSLRFLSFNDTYQNYDDEQTLEFTLNQTLGECLPEYLFFQGNYREIPKTTVLSSVNPFPSPILVFSGIC